jgi:hypothetical protein
MLSAEIQALKKRATVESTRLFLIFDLYNQKRS